MKKSLVLLAAFIVVWAVFGVRAAGNLRNFTLVQEDMNADSPENDSGDLSASQGGAFQYVLLVDVIGRERTAPPLDDGFDSNATALSPVPEPGMLLLLGFSLMSLFVIGQRRFRKSSH